MLGIFQSKFYERGLQGEHKKTNSRESGNLGSNSSLGFGEELLYRDFAEISLS